jgi:hypothetical protein
MAVCVMSTTACVEGMGLAEGFLLGLRDGSDEGAREPY